MKKDTYRLDDKNEFDLIVYYDPGSKKPWETVIVRKSVNGIVDKKYLKEKNAAILKFILDNANEDHRFLGSNDLPSDRPKGYNLGFSVYRAIRGFLGNYSDRIITEPSRNGGVYFDITNVICIRGETVSPPKVISVIGQMQPISCTPENPDDDRPVTPRKLWEAGRRTYLQSKAGGGRFRLLDIEEQIMPFYSKDDKRAHSKGIDLPIQVRIGNSKDEFPLTQALDTTQRNYYLIGEGGIGKTTAMFRIMEQHYKEASYDPKGEIPLFVELNRAPGIFERWYYDPEKMKSRFIRMEIGRQLLDLDTLSQVPDETVHCITAEFKAFPPDGKPKYLLLLDGLNEVSIDDITDESRHINGQCLSGNVRQLIIEEIILLFKECPNVRIILTSRTDESGFTGSRGRIEKLYLTGLKEEHIREYLEQKKFTQPEIDAAIANKRLTECLVIPLFLTMYADLRDVSGISSRGEILSKFFHERGENISYTQQDVIERLKLQTYHLWFILDFLLPAIGHEMENKGVFEIQKNEIEEIIEPILRGWKPLAEGYEPIEIGKKPYDAAIIGEYGAQCFEKYRIGRNDVETIAEKILTSEKNISRVTKYVLDSAMNVLKILHYSKGKYSFIHHHFRDYFAAVHEVNLLRIAVCTFENDRELAFNCLAPFIVSPNHQEKSIFIGEILGERKNVPVLDGTKWKYNVPKEPCDRNLIKRAMDIFRGRFGKEVGYGVYNLIEILKLVREDLSGSDFSELDLLLVNLNGIRLGHTSSDRTDFHGSRLGLINLLCPGHRDVVTSVAYAPDSKTFLSGARDSTVRIWDSSTGQCLHVCEGHNDGITSVVFSHDGSFFLSGSWDQTVRGWNSITGQCLFICKGLGRSITSVAIAPDDQTFLFGLTDGTLRVWDRASGKCIRICEEHSNGVTSVTFAPDGKTFISGSSNCTVRIWDSATWQCLHVCRGHRKGITSVAFASDGKIFLSGSIDNTVRIWDSVTGQCLRVCEGHRASVNSVAFSPNGKTFISGSSDGTIRIWDSSTGHCLHTCEGHDRGVHFVHFAPDGKTFLSGSSDLSVKVWNSATWQCLNTCKGHDNRINAVHFSPNGKTFLSGSADTTIRVWDSSTGQCLHVCEGHNDGITSLAFAPDGNTFLSGSFDRTVGIWDCTNWQCLSTLEGHSRTVTSVAFAPDAQTFLSGSWDNTIRVWNKATMQCLCICKDHSSGVNSVVFSPDGKTFLSGSSDHTIKLWDNVTGQCLHTYDIYGNRVNSVAFAPDGKTFIFGSCDNSVRIWSIQTGQCLFTIPGHNYRVTSVAFAQDGKTFLSGSDDKTVRIWDSASGHCLHICEGHSSVVTTVSFAPDGKTILSGSADGTIRVWSVETGECLHEICNYPGLIVFGCDMRNLHASSEIDKDILRQYGAIV